MIKTSKLLFSLTALFISATASFAGLLGENYVLAGLSYTRVSATDAYDGFGGGIQVNHNVIHQDHFGLDITGFHSYSRMSGHGTRHRSYEATLGVTAFTEYDIFRPYFSVLTGWSWQKQSSLWYGSGKDDSWFYGAEGGVEINVNDAFSITPWIALGRFDKANVEEWSFGINAHYWISERVGFGLGYSFSDGPFVERTGTAVVTIRY